MSSFLPVVSFSSYSPSPLFLPCINQDKEFRGSRTFWTMRASLFHVSHSPVWGALSSRVIEHRASHAVVKAVPPLLSLIIRRIGTRLARGQISGYLEFPKRRERDEAQWRSLRDGHWRDSSYERKSLWEISQILGRSRRGRIFRYRRYSAGVVRPHRT